MKFFQVHETRDVLRLIEETYEPLERFEEVALYEAFGRVLAEDVRAAEDVPGFDRSTVDGYAVRAQETYGANESMPSFLDLTGVVEMGGEAGSVGAGQAKYIPTGGMMPDGADAVVMIEHAEEVGALLNVYKQVAPGENVIRRGEDVRAGQLILSRGHRLEPQDLGLMAAVGVSRVKVFAKPVVGILSTGDEIVPPETKQLKPGEIRDINTVAIGASLNSMGAEVIYGGIVKDQYEEYLARAKALFEKVDMLIMSGGSSVGTRDYTVQVMQELGEPGILVHGISVKPGKPTILAKAGRKPVVGLPGHPASALVIFDLVVRRIVNRLYDRTPHPFDPRIRARLSRNLPSAVGRSDYVRVRLEKRDGEVWAVPVFGKSGLVSTLTESHGVIEIPGPKEGLLQGEWVEVNCFAGERGIVSEEEDLSGGHAAGCRSEETPGCC
ncbi:gephyrin-like molybdotransferase Glp [Effusibacillus lacus]|uniref:Molybdopterin molybdenumtransferase n=1 Tax=Effusibacillus lacus TaxID=1348429 RepID=A0A292YNA8_9BACL|nr:gephyrin-like molybdotransferase Glp [Effusibacillus lacus]TCS71430.1 molybdopterin molybdochelatase [Effusibacillus lacus]GAX89960.1 molybdopterin molybdenumtransferase MoeA [Effusibacillus lacus]